MRAKRPNKDVCEKESLPISLPRTLWAMWPPPFMYPSERRGPSATLFRRGGDGQEVAVHIRGGTPRKIEEGIGDHIIDIIDLS